MRKNLLILTLFAVSIVNAMSPVDVVKSFGDNLSSWCKTKDIRYCDAMKDLASGNKAFRVSDQIIKDYPPKGLEKTQANFNNYITVFQNNIHDGISVTYSNIKIDNSPVFGINLFGNQDAPKCVSCDIHIAGALKYDIKDIFYVRDGKIVAIADYYSDMTFNTGLLLCKQKRYKEALDVFEQIIQAPFDYHEEEQAKNFALSLLMKRSNKLDLGRHAIKYKIARLFYKTQGLLNTTPMLPLLDENNYDTAMRSPISTKVRVVQLPLHLYETIPYWEGSLGLCDRDYCRYVYTGFRPIEKTRFAIKKKKLFGYIDEKDKVVISPRFHFAYPFDEKVGFALVRYPSGEWGYIDKQGNHHFRYYDVASDVFFKGKTYVIKGGTLYLMDAKGTIINSFKGYVDLAHPIKENEILAVYQDNNRLRYDLLDFDGNIVTKDCSKEALGYTLSILAKYEECGGCSLKYRGRRKESF